MNISARTIPHGFFPFQNVEDICNDILPDMNLSCPVKRGMFSFKKKLMYITKYFPPVSIVTE